jgi:hypothetical protein
MEAAEAVTVAGLESHPRDAVVWATANAVRPPAPADDWDELEAWSDDNTE